MKNVLFVICLLVFTLKIWSANVPVLSKNSQTFLGILELTIASPESCIVYITTNKNVPTRNDKRYHDGMILTYDSSVTITAKAFRFFPEISDSSNVRWEDGGIVTATFTKILQQPQVQIMPISADSIGVFMFTPDIGAKIFYTVNGNVPDSMSKQYSDVLHFQKNVQLKVRAIKNGSVSSSIWNRE